jgi:hypothetical protein
LYRGYRQRMLPPCLAPWKPVSGRELVGLSRGRPCVAPRRSKMCVVTNPLQSVGNNCRPRTISCASNAVHCRAWLYALGSKGILRRPNGKRKPNQLGVCPGGQLWSGVESRARTIVIWLILPVVICLFQRLSHACLSISELVQ